MGILTECQTRICRFPNKCQTNLDSITLGAGTPSNAASLLLCNFVVQLRARQLHCVLRDVKL